MDGRIFFLRQQINQKLEQAWHIDDLASLVDLSPQHLSHLFKRNMGISPMSYVTELRLERARELIETTFLQIKQVGVQTGLVNDSHFTRNFKRKYGMTPTECRTQYWQLEQTKHTDGQKS